MAEPTPTKARIPFHVFEAERPTLVLIHGFLDAGRVWDPVVAQLSQEGLATVTLDLPGMGGTQIDASEIDLDRYADDVASVVATLDTKVVLVGQSMGAQVAELVAIRLPEKVTGLVLVTPVPLGGVGAPDEAVAPFADSGGQPEIQKQLRQGLSHNLEGSALDDLAALGDPVAPEVVKRLVEVWNVGHPLGQKPSTFAGPVEIIRGVVDPFCDAAMIERTATRFDGSKTVTIEAAGHWAHVERPVEVAKALSEFVRAISSPAGNGAIGTDAPAGDWKGAFSQKSSQAFAQTFAEDVTLEASVLNVPVTGREIVKKVMEAASKVYSALSFTAQGSGESKQYLEWKATAHAGVEFDGVTVLTRNAAGEIAHVAIHHRPMQAAIFFSQTMGESLSGEIDEKHFLHSRALAEI